MELWEQLSLPENWQDFLDYKIEKQHLSHKEQKELKEYIENQRYLSVLDDIDNSDCELPLPVKKEINKTGTTKKRAVYSFPGDFNLFLKMITYLLGRYDERFADNCYAFRRNYGVKDAVRRIRSLRNLDRKYCLKVDISNYFNSIDVSLLLDKLAFLQMEDRKLYDFLECLLTVDKALIPEEGREICIPEKRGAMAGTPFSPFLANVYLADTDYLFQEMKVPYFRYSDDILVFADTWEQLEKRQRLLYEILEQHHLTLNLTKVHISGPGETIEFLGFLFDGGRVDLASSTLQKMKDRIRRKAHALRRWQRKKGLSSERAAKGFIRAMNRKFYDDGDASEFSWSRWFFPCLTTDNGLKEIDTYMQQYIRFCVTGRHYKGNYRITYQQMKQWGYRSLVHEYYTRKTAVKS